MIYDKCPMCGMENIEYFHNREEWKTALICYGCNYVEVKKRFYIKSKEEEKILCDHQDNLEKRSSLTEGGLS